MQPVLQQIDLCLSCCKGIPYTLPNNLMGITETIKNYIHNRIELAKLKSVEWAANVGADIISSLVFIFILFFALLFFSLWAGMYLSFYLDNEHVGFALVASFYLALAILYKLFHKPLLEKPLQDKITSSLLDEPASETVHKITE